MRQAYLLSILILAGCSPRSDQSNAMLAARTRAVDIAANFMQSGDTTGLRDAFSDSVIAAYSPSDMISARSDMINALGEFQGARDLHFHSDSESHVTFSFEHGEMEFTLTHDSSGKIMFISNEVQSEHELSALSSGKADTNDVRLTDLNNTDDLRTSFNSDSQFVRLVSLLSPT